ncbi:2-amino-4-hydroxy-6-hydroxymethyldihydropteridinediphosphokinase [Desulfuromusa kysingii]|uniref:2-amino-4-hydroxy-6-hydroxymethyldihydropteridine pyrophosphokinase n=2 Tax=Desulfuromusa kysingii TaxID=37625 RepID=A0A1H3VHW2_9BACT|nr:2-amino-4-hydroxy-6-hydroxymethyldihydropteridinediphosphokinase [Desulfuromusa kysingii]
MTMKNKSRAFLGFGGNLGNPLERFRHARETLAKHPKISVISSAPLYQTPPIGGPEGQPDFLNTVVEIHTGLFPAELLQLCGQIEACADRIREQHWGPRTLDIDLLLIDELILEDPQLTLPHPRMHQRHFVLLPLNDLAPQLNHPLLHKTISHLLQALPVADGIIRVNETW